MKTLILALLLLATPASAQQLKILVGSTTDAYGITARIVSRHIGKYLPENPAVVIQEMPGSADINLANYLYNIAPKDGTVIGTFKKNIPTLSALGNPVIKYNAEKFTWLGSVSDGRDDAVIMWSNKSGPIARFRTEELIVGAENIVAADPTLLIKEVLDIKMKVIAGYSKSSENRLAFERREVDAVVYNLAGIKVTKPEWLRPNSGVYPLIQFGNGAIRHKEYLHVPTLYELTLRKELLNVFEKQFALLRPFVAPPDIPEARAKELRDAFEKVVYDNEFLAEAKQAGIDVKLISWKEAEQIVSETVNAPQKVLDEIRSLK